MNVWLRLTGTCKGGRFIPDSRDRLDGIMQELDGQRFEMAIRPETRNRTLPQNALLHVLVNLIADHTGETVTRVKRVATLEALGIERGTTREQILGQTIYEVRHTSDLDTEECSLVVDKLQEHCKFLELSPPRDEDVEVLS